MLRIVDMSEATGAPGAFAVWDTVRNQFIDFQHTQCWDSAEEFKDDIEQKIARNASPETRGHLYYVRDRVLALLGNRPLRSDPDRCRVGYIREGTTTWDEVLKRHTQVS